MKRLTTEEFIIRAWCVHGDKYNYALVDYKNSKEKVKVICSDHGVFEQKPNNHLMGQGCPKCADISRFKTQQLTTDEFIERARKIHGDKYDYSRVEYINAKTKVEIICPIHGSFWQNPSSHLNGIGCPKCSKKYKPTTEEFIEKAKEVHGDIYIYDFVNYENARKNVEFVCRKHGPFWQTPDKHLNGQGCPKCAGKYKERYTSNNIPVYDKYEPQLSPYGVECRRSKDDENILEVKCMYCDRWFIPSLCSIKRKISSINGKTTGENNLYCSDNCKIACPTYGQIKYPKGFKTNTSREVQPSLRKLVLKRDNYTCQKCGTKDTELHCHHYEGIKVNPIESADMDNCITLCKKCHNEIHTKEKCGTSDYKC